MADPYALTLARLVQLADECESARFERFGAMREDQFVTLHLQQLGRLYEELSIHHTGGDRREPMGRTWALSFLYLLQVARAYIEDEDLAAALEAAPEVLRAELAAESAAGLTPDG